MPPNFGILVAPLLGIRFPEVLVLLQQSSFPLASKGLGFVILKFYRVQVRSFDRALTELWASFFFKNGSKTFGQCLFWAAGPFLGSLLTFSGLLGLFWALIWALSGLLGLFCAFSGTVLGPRPLWVFSGVGASCVPFQPLLRNDLLSSLARVCLFLVSSS